MEPACIRKLDEAVVNRIAAGEVIQRPANALKELLENSLDAKATSIQITVKSGGLKLLQIQDNGTGIRHEDLEIVCERFTTSKLSDFEDLQRIGTFGFRGEALASISHVAHLSIQTKTAQDKCGYKASYEDGKLKAAPKPCAGNQGTIICIEDLFYNMPQRKQALKSPAEEFQKISDVVTKYAVQNAQVSFTLKRFGEQATLKTAMGSNVQENIRNVFGAQIAKELLEVQLQDALHKFKLRGYITKVNYAAKKPLMVLFINQRLVESAALKAALDAAYSVYLPRGMNPFIYMSLELDAASIDVNVHPTKHEVHFLHEEEIIEKIKAAVESKLLGSNSTRVFYKQLKLPGVEEPAAQAQNTDTSAKEAASQSLSVTRCPPKDMIRTDAKEQKLTKFLSTSQDYKPKTLTAVAKKETAIGTNAASKQVRLTSVLDMQKRIERSCSVLLRKTMKELVFVGVVDHNYALFQHDTKLYLCNTLKYSEELFYQRLVYGFENLAHISIEPALPLRDLLLLALNSQEGSWTPEFGPKEDLAERAVQLLLSKAVIMEQYFAMRINADGQLCSLPALLAQHRPCTTFLPCYILRLATEVEWDTEEECFETFCRETANFYARVSLTELQQQPKQHHWLAEHVLYPGFKQYLLPDNKLKQHVYELTNLPALYKVFERC